MILKGFHNYMRGSVRCDVTGVHPERFFNKCVAAGIAFWDVQYVTPNRMMLSMSARDYRRIRPVARDAGCTLRLIKKRGALYSSRRLRRRYILLFGAAVLAFFLWAMNSLILTIDVTGYEQVTPAEILDAMKAEGVGIGTRVSMVDASRLRNKILLEIPELSWFTVTIKGAMPLWTCANAAIRRRYLTLRSRPILSQTERASLPLCVYSGEKSR